MAREPYLGSTLWGHIYASLSVVLAGWLLAGVVGVPLGIAMAWWPRLRWIVFPLFQLVRPVPPLAWIPLAIIWLGIGDTARMSVVFIAALVPWLMNSMQAVYSVDALLVHAARTLGASNRQILTRVVGRTALPTLVAGARIALGNAWTTLIAAELLAASAGLGFVALNASRTLETGVLLVAMGVIGLLGALMSVGMRVRDARARAVVGEGQRAMPSTHRATSAIARVAGAARGAPARSPRCSRCGSLATSVAGLVPATRAALARRGRCSARPRSWPRPSAARRSRATRSRR